MRSITNNGQGVGTGSAQGVVGFRMPGSDSLYYLFHNIASDCAYPDQWACYLYYSLVDMSKNNGMGKVVDLNHIIYTDSEFYLSHTAINACRHANGVDWWLMQGKAFNPAENLLFLVDKQGIHEPIHQSLGDTTWSINPAGRVVFSPDGTLMAKALGIGRTHLFDFNRCDGTLSNLRYISTVDSIYDPDSLSSAGSIAFSSSGRFLYVNTIVSVFQYDLWAANIQESEVQIWAIDTLNSDYTLFIMQLASDGRIYIGPHSSGSDRKNLTIINKPNEEGAACDFRYGGVSFPNMKWHGLGVPNMPDFRLYTSPVYQAHAGADQTICKDSVAQIGMDTLIRQLVYTWSSNNPFAYISNPGIPNPIISTTKDETEFYLNVVDTASILTCLERSDTVMITTYSCNPNLLHLPTFINARITPYFFLSSLAEAISLKVFNTAGQLIFKNNNYQNDWNVSLCGSGVYVIEVITRDNNRYRGKVVVIN